ncbi:hypothetical protein XELAEV_18024723mg [Xenopus laevis]|uniref:Uncharacterized protein n=1 Tax=Xenopus laevis TaxID=8355 RepID=A0A974D0J9_XENLA|nr:hypothetical protein XELAEV_18024723mg [Xenopus laevis]
MTSLFKFSMKVFKLLSSCLNSSFSSYSFICSQICFCWALMVSNSSMLCCLRSNINLLEHSCNICSHSVLNAVGMSSKEGKIWIRNPLGTM